MAEVPNVPTVIIENEHTRRAVANRLLDQKISFSFTGDYGAISCPTLGYEQLKALADECADGALKISYDQPEGRGSVTLVPGHCGAHLLIDGVEFGLIDLFYNSASYTEDGERPSLPPQLLLFCPTYEDEPLAKVIVEDDKMVVIGHADAQFTSSHPRGIHHHGDDVFRLPPSLTSWKPVNSPDASPVTPVVEGRENGS